MHQTDILLDTSKLVRPVAFIPPGVRLLELLMRRKAVATLTACVWHFVPE